MKNYRFFLILLSFLLFTGIAVQGQSKKQKELLKGQLSSISDCTSLIYADLKEDKKEYYIDLINKVEL